MYADWLFEPHRQRMREIALRPDLAQHLEVDDSGNMGESTRRSTELVVVDAVVESQDDGVLNFIEAESLTQ